MTMADWNAGYQQVLQLASLPIDKGIGAKARHVPVLVTNGHVHEGVYSAIEKFNYKNNLDKLNSKKLEIWDRGVLVNLFASYAGLIWPVDLESQLQIMKMLAASGRDPIDGEQYGNIVLQVLRWATKPSKRARRERALGALLVANVVSGRWRQSGDLCEVMKIETTTLLTVAGYLEKYGATSKEVDAVCAFSWEQIRQNAAAVSRYVIDNGQRPLSERDVFNEVGFYHQRKALMIGVAAIDILIKQGAGQSRPDEVFEFFKEIRLFKFLDSEGVIPSVLAIVWALGVVLPTKKADKWLLALVGAMITLCTNPDPRRNLPGPYYSMEVVARWKHSEYLGIGFGPIDRDSFRFRSWFLDALFLMVVRRNWKQHAKRWWGTLTHIIHTESRVLDDTRFGWPRIDDEFVEERAKNYPNSRAWDDVVGEASAARKPAIPKWSKERPELIALYCLFFPYRAGPDVVLWLDSCFAKTWYGPSVSSLVSSPRS